MSQLSSNFEFLLLPLICLILLTLYHGAGYGERLIANPATVFLGEISYSIYLLHPFGQILGDAILKNSARIYSITDGWLILTAEIAGVIALATLGYYVVERPMRRLINGRFDRRQNLLQFGRVGERKSRRLMIK